jgi:hypothetical protein
VRVSHRVQQLRQQKEQVVHLLVAAPSAIPRLVAASVPPILLRWRRRRQRLHRQLRINTQ